MSHPYKRDRRPVSNTGTAIDVLSIDVNVTTDDRRVITLSYELSLEDVPEKFHNEITAVITLSLDSHDGVTEVSEELYEGMGNVFVDEVRDCIKAINMDINSFLTTNVKEEIKMNATTTTTTATAATGASQPVEDVTPKSETPNPTSMMDRIAAYENHLAKNDVRLDEHQKRLDGLLTEVENIKANQRVSGKEDSGLGFGGWATLAVVVGVVGGTGYYFGSR